MHVNDSKAFTDYANDIDANYNTIQIKNIILFVFYDMIAHMFSNKKL